MMGRVGFAIKYKKKYITKAGFSSNINEAKLFNSIGKAIFEVTFLFNGEKIIDVDIISIATVDNKRESIKTQGMYWFLDSVKTLRDAKRSMGYPHY